MKPDINKGQFFSLKCPCECGFPLIRTNDSGDNEIVMFRSEELAKLAAADLTFNGEHPIVSVFQISEVK